VASIEMAQEAHEMTSGEASMALPRWSQKTLYRQRQDGIPHRPLEVPSPDKLSITPISRRRMRIWENRTGRVEIRPRHRLLTISIIFLGGKTHSETESDFGVMIS
jgi:hypothetical protein